MSLVHVVLRASRARRSRMAGPAWSGVASLLAAQLAAPARAGAQPVHSDLDLDLDLGRVHGR